MYHEMKQYPSKKQQKPCVIDEMCQQKCWKNPSLQCIMQSCCLATDCAQKPEQPFCPLKNVKAYNQ